MHFHLKNSLTDDSRRGSGGQRTWVIFSEGDTIQFARVSVATAGAWLVYCQFFCNSISDFIFRCHCEMIQFCRFLWKGGNICMPGMYLCIFFISFPSACRYQSQTKCELCANLLHTQKYLLYCMAIKAPHDWHAKWNIFEWYFAAVNALTWNMSKSVYLSISKGNNIQYKSIWKSQLCHGLSTRNS